MCTLNLFPNPSAAWSDLSSPEARRLLTGAPVNVKHYCFHLLLLFLSANPVFNAVFFFFVKFRIEKEQISKNKNVTSIIQFSLLVNPLYDCR